MADLRAPQIPYSWPICAPQIPLPSRSCPQLLINVALQYPGQYNRRDCKKMVLDNLQTVFGDKPRKKDSLL